MSVHRHNYFTCELLVQQQHEHKHSHPAVTGTTIIRSAAKNRKGAKTCLVFIKLREDEIKIKCALRNKKYKYLGVYIVYLMM
jgi:hypothetical protein